MDLRAGDRVRGIRGQSGGAGTVRQVKLGRRLPMLSGESVMSEDVVVVEWDHIPGAQTAPQRTNEVPASALERVRPT